MSIFVIGINHKTATIALREKVYFAVDKLPLYLQDLLNCGLAQEAVLLSTCNRSELYCLGDDADRLRDWFCMQTTLSRDEMESAIYIYRDEEAVAHMMSVACGLDSMILGEPQILGQMKSAFSESCAARAIDASFHRLFQQIFIVAKEIRTSTSIGACPVSVASAAVHFAKQTYGDFSQANVILIGAGETTELIIRYLQNELDKPITIVNRCTEKAAALLEPLDGQVYGLDKLHLALASADVVFSATGSATPLVNQMLISEVMQKRLRRSMLLIDIAVPRDIDPAVSELDNIKLFCIDDLKAIIETNRQGREHAAVKAREMIRKKSTEFMAEIKCMDNVAHTIRAYRSQIEEICRAELTKARQQLHQGVDPMRVLEAFANAYTRKLMHSPSVQLREAAVKGHHELLRFAKQLFSIPDSEVT